jgi:hypothetical protein
MNGQRPEPAADPQAVHFAKRLGVVFYGRSKVVIRFARYG